MMKRSPNSTPKTPPVKRGKFPPLPEEDLKVLTKRMVCISFTLPPGSPFTTEDTSPLNLFWAALYTGLGLINRKFQGQLKEPTYVDWADLLNDQDSGLYEILDRLAKEPVLERDWKPLLTFPGLRRPSAPPGSKTPLQTAFSTLYKSSSTATMMSWSREFQGSGVKALEQHIWHYLVVKSVPYPYTAFMSITQSSGMGKSRLIDEFSKIHFVIPLNLRDPSSTGFPPSDKEVYSYLTSSEANSVPHICRFLVALFRRTKETVNTLKLECSDESLRELSTLASAFRDCMTDGQSTSGPGDFRTDFFKDVVDATRKNKHAPAIGATELEDAYQDLEDAICNDSDMSHRCMPKIYIMWDDAHYLGKGLCSELHLQREPICSILERVLFILRRKNLFSFFVSTSGRPSPLVPTFHIHPSTVIMPELPPKSVPPFTDFGFDHLMAGRQVGMIGAQTLADVTKLEYVVHMGRPLWGGCYNVGSKDVKKNILGFAQTKLLGQRPEDATAWTSSPDQLFACLSQRLALELDSRTPADLLKEQNLVENHMRVCLKIGSGFEDPVTTSSSEPILSEASSLLTRLFKDFSMPEALKKIFSEFPIKHERQGALLVLVMFTIARDSAIPRYHEWYTSIPIASVPSFFEQLFAEDISDMLPSRVARTHEPRSFKDVFSRANMHFNHCVKRHDAGMLTRSMLLGFIARGAAIVHQPAVDMIVPFLFYDLKLVKWNVGFILAKVDGGAVPRVKLFDTMDPFVLGLFEDGEPTVPIIRIIFALGVAKEKAKLVRMPYHVQDDVTSYDFWCAGMSPEILKPAATAPWTWDELLAASCGWAKIYDVESEEKTAYRRQQNPLAVGDTEHWNQFMDARLGEMKAEDYLKDFLD
ncbi:hypothetical protein ARMSODRAFT_1003086 [Armillaria solidipes]|uniref:Uncharacterized protein n=1 Tax=Armillaria solidipes TaxID=1076256 RepID=A0A2H3BK75_9AGAR|nr:hypothetical protein ARMSODRAFT_1003086 [Armillaria solidipes]